MSRITGSDAQGLMEAYASVYYPQELTEDQVWEEVEVWVNSLVEEGYDLSEYTWEDMYEEYLKEYTRQADRPGQTPAEAKAAEKSAKERGASAARAYQAKADAYKPGGLVGGVKDFLRSLPKGQGKMDSDLGKPDPTVKPTTAKPLQPTNAPYQSRFAGARDVAFARARQIQGSPVVGPRVAAPAPTRPVATPAPTRPAATQTTTKPTTTATAPATPRQRDTSITDMIGRSQIRQGAPINTGNVTSDIRSRSLRGSLRGTDIGGSGVPAPKPNLQQQIRQRRLNMDFDPFDIVQGYLIDEGYAETEEAAAVIMANMSEEWKESILDEASAYGARKGTIRSVIAKGGTGIRYVAKGGDIVAGDRAAAERASDADRVRSGKNRANAARAEQERKKSIERLNSKPGEDEGDYDSGYYGDDDTSDGKRHYSLSHTNRHTRRRRASGR